MYPRSGAGALRRPAIAEPRPRPSGIGKDPRPFTSNPRNPPFTFPHPTLLSLGPAASPPIVPVLECLPKSVWCFALWVFSDHRPPPSSKAPESPLRVICDISPRPRPQSCSFCPDHPETRRLETPTQPTQRRPPSRTTLLDRHRPATKLRARVCSGRPPVGLLLDLSLPSPTFLSPILRRHS